VTPDLYIPVILGLCALVAAVATVAIQRPSVPARLGWMAVTIGVLALLAWIDWEVQARHETPARTYALLAVAVPLLSFGAAFLVARRGSDRQGVYLTAFGTAILGAVFALFSSFY
jgi:hypothetical protein